MNTKKKILNGYAGLGGNSKYWDTDKFEITAIEKDPKIAKVYKENNPGHKVIVGDIIDYLLNNYQDYDIIWLSPPCQANSRMIRSGKNRKPRLPDLTLYELKIFLDYNFKGKYVIENVKPYYKPVIEPTAILGRHLFWANFEIGLDFELKQPKNFINTGTVAGSKDLKKWLDIDYEGNLYYERNHDPCQVLRNCVYPKMGEHVLNALIGACT
jgi:DNA (cytosine-5)-methyltransferase 1